MIATDTVVLGFVVIGPLYLLVTAMIFVAVSGNRQRGRH